MNEPETRRRRVPVQTAPTDPTPVVGLPEYPARARAQFEIGETFGIPLAPEVDDKGKPVLDAAGKPVRRLR